MTDDDDDDAEPETRSPRSIAVTASAEELGISPEEIDDNREDEHGDESDES